MVTLTLEHHRIRPKLIISQHRRSPNISERTTFYYDTLMFRRDFNSHGPFRCIGFHQNYKEALLFEHPMVCGFYWGSIATTVTLKKASVMLRKMRHKHRCCLNKELFLSAEMWYSLAKYHLKTEKIWSWRLLWNSPPKNTIKIQEWLLWDVLWTGYIKISSPLRENEQSPRWSKKSSAFYLWHWWQNARDIL